MKIPLRDGTEFDLAPFLDGYRHKYPHVDLGRELALMNLWLARNPSKWPLKPFRFVDNWLAKLKPKLVKLSLASGTLTEHEVIALAAKLGTQARPGESYAQLARRLADLQSKAAPLPISTANR